MFYIQAAPNYRIQPNKFRAKDRHTHKTTTTVYIINTPITSKMYWLIFIRTVNIRSSAFHSFQCTNLSLPRLSLFLSILLFFDDFVSRIIFLVSFSETLLFLCRNAADFCVLILYTVILLNSFVPTDFFCFYYVCNH